MQIKLTVFVVDDGKCVPFIDLSPFLLVTSLSGSFSQPDTSRYFVSVRTPLCNRTSGIYILTRYSEITPPDRHVFHQVTPFCQVAVLVFKNTQMIYAGCAKVAPRKPLTGRIKLKISPGIGEAKFSLCVEEKSTGSGFTGSVTEGCVKIARFADSTEYVGRRLALSFQGSFLFYQQKERETT